MKSGSNDTNVEPKLMNGSSCREGPRNRFQEAPSAGIEASETDSAITAEQRQASTNTCDRVKMWNRAHMAAIIANAHFSGALAEPENPNSTPNDQTLIAKCEVRHTPRRKRGAPPPHRLNADCWLLTNPILP